MLKFPKLSALCVLFISLGTTASADKLGIGRAALPEEIAIWNIDVRPDGQGLPMGSGTVTEGESVFTEKCASCHGEFGEGNGRWPVLAGGQGTLKSNNPVKTIGSYWPYLSTLFDYIQRAMPFGEAQTLTVDETYSLVAYLLYLNDLMDDDGTLSDENFTDFRLPNEVNFRMDPRPDVATVSQQEPCMKNCKSDVKILGRARSLDVTPETED
ncbi:c-type cytochrome [Sneathiella aquimaris]|uniref:c-type cytochrome n=1 Tax=Sneathiella aquimaris TaxID=2599305 RepID=UPI002260B225|nr:cytochrome c [Sneathiella aquimaris]